MIDPSSDNPTPPLSDTPPEPSPAWPILAPPSLRVLGCLIEKAITTPEYYPLTLNALTNACNQKSNRDPEMNLDDSEVSLALDDLRIKHRLAAIVHTAGSRVEKYKHTLSSLFPVDPPQAAILCELFLRGPQTPGELKTRASRMFAFPDLNHVQQTLDALAGLHPAPLVVKLPREPGRRESRWMHVLAGVPDLTADPDPTPPLTSAPPSLRQELDQLRQEVEVLKSTLAQIQSTLSHLTTPPS
ncbi:MAG TPA: YceH family protein [Kiritimatiellia bacterium]|nr:YceH family protein [Kiritimatiellia bacterium]